MRDKLKKKKNLRSLTVTLALAFLALSVVVLLISSSLNIYFSLQTQEKAIADQQQFIAEDAANTVKNFIQEKFTLLKAIASFSNLTAAQKEEQELALARLLGVEPAFRQSVLLDKQEQELVRVSRLSKSLSAQLMKYNRSELFSKVSQKETYICSIYIDAISSEPMIVMAVPVTDVFGDFKGVLIAEVNLKFMWDLVDSIKVGETGAAFVVDMDGNLIAYSDTSRVLKGENLNHLDEVKEFTGGNKSAHESESEISKGIIGEDVVTTHVHLGNPDWAVVVELPVQEAYEDVNRELRLSLYVMFLCFILAVVIGILLSKRITKPIIKLRDATREISKGNLDIKIVAKSKGEIGELATSFNLMTSELKESRQELEENRRSLEKKVEERTADLARSNAELEQFAYVASHDLQEPLRMVHSYLTLIERRYEGHLDKEADEFIEFAVDGAKRMQTMINDLLTYSRVGTRGKPFESTDCSLVVNNAIKNLEMAIEESKGKVESEPLPTIIADESQMIQLFQNIIANAIKYHGEEKPYVQISVKNDKDKWIFSVKDNSIGIDQNHSERIFQIFQRLHTRDEYSGTGIGLAVSKKIVERHGGRIWVESEPGEGSTFYFTIPNNGGVKE